MPPPFSSTDYDTTIINSSQIIDRTIKGIDIGLGTIELNNLSAAAIASLGGGGLTPNSIDSSHIIDGGITGDDINITSSITCNDLTSEFITVNEGTFNSQIFINGTIFTHILQFMSSAGTKVYGTATLVGGTVTVTNALATTTSSSIFLSRNNVVSAANMGHLYVVKGTGSFQIVSTNPNDNNAVDYLIIRGLP
jgi:hypothetical protein